MLPLIGASGVLDLSLLYGLSGLATFSRVTTGTYLSSGTILTAAANVPRFEAPGLLLEPQSTNLIAYSVLDAGTHWFYTNATGTANAAIAPDGTTTACAVADNATSGAHTAQMSFAAVSGTVYTVSCLVKAGTATVVQLGLPSATFSGLFYANFNLSSGTVGTSNTPATITPIGNGWYLVSITATATATASSSLNILLTNSNPSAARSVSYVGSGQSLYVWGGQAEALGGVTSVIPTAGSTVTRALDALSLNLARLPWWQTAAGCSLALECDVLTNTPTATVLFGVCGAGGFAAGCNYVAVSGGNINAVPIGGTASGYAALPAPGATLKAAMSIVSGGAVGFAVNGVALSSGSCPAQPLLTTLSILQPPWSLGSGTWNGHAHRLRLWNYPLTAAQLAQVTT